MINRKGILVSGIASSFLLILFFAWMLSILQSEAKKNKTIILATTTSVQDTGLLDVLAECFNKKGEYILKPISVGSGQAIQLGRKAEADILLVHSPEDEELFMKEGFGLKRSQLMYNEFVLAGPPDDPAKVKGLGILEAFRNICSAKSIFISRGDNSGTHKMELTIWKASDCKPDSQNYFETGQGMGQTVRIADERRGYSLVDMATYLTLKKTLHLTILSSGDEHLKNVYSLIIVNPGLSDKINLSGTKSFYDFMLSEEVKKIINNHKIDAYGQQLFFTENGLR